MKHLLIVLLALATGTVCRAAETQADFFVSVRGSDSWSGTLAAPNAQRSDGPFATLERARDAVRDLKQNKSTDIVVLIREGTYQLKNTVVFGLEDSGVGDVDGHLCGLSRRDARVQFGPGNQGLEKGVRRTSRLARGSSGETMGSECLGPVLHPLRCGRDAAAGAVGAFCSLEGREQERTPFSTRDA